MLDVCFLGVFISAVPGEHTPTPINLPSALPIWLPVRQSMNTLH